MKLRAIGKKNARLTERIDYDGLQIMFHAPSLRSWNICEEKGKQWKGHDILWCRLIKTNQQEDQKKLKTDRIIPDVRN